MLFGFLPWLIVLFFMAGELLCGKKDQKAKPGKKHNRAVASEADLLDKSDLRPIMKRGKKKETD